MTILKMIISTPFGRKIISYICRVLGVVNNLFYKKDRILFYAPEGNFLTDNSKALYDYLLENGYNRLYEIICSIPKGKSIKNKKTTPYNVKNVGGC